MSVIAVPIGPVPISLATFAIFCCGTFLGPKWGTASVLVYMLIGFIGVPVFAEFSSGLGVLAGPTGGFLIGYPIAALIVGLLTTAFNKSNRFWMYPVAIIAGAAADYALGIAWFMHYANSGILPALTACLVPFIPGDTIKIIGASLLSYKLKPVVTKLEA
jgi:biotin transport system substrate-specific component